MVGNVSGGGLQQQPSQRRRRAFGRDISDHEAQSRANRGSVGGDAMGSGGGKGGDATASSKPTSKSGIKKVVAVPKTSFATEPFGVNRARLGVEIIGTKVGADLAKPIPVTSRWSDYDVQTEIRSPFDSTGVPEEELYMMTKLRDEAANLRKDEDDERDRLVLERHEEHCMEMMRVVHLDDYGGGLEGFGIDDLLESNFPWEEEVVGGFNPAEERRLSGNDPDSLWGDLMNY